MRRAAWACVATLVLGCTPVSRDDDAGTPGGSDAGGSSSGSADGGPRCPVMADCTGRECGVDPICGVACGFCQSGQKCIEGTCECEGSCNGRECGDDGCGNSCGVCEGDPATECLSTGTTSWQITRHPTCVVGQCRMEVQSAETITCGFGCEVDHCAPSPCANVTCSDPVRSSCLGHAQVVEPITPGRCLEATGTCDFAQRILDCDHCCIPSLGRCSSDVQECLQEGVVREFFVAPGGNDANAGTIDSPFRTLARAAAMADRPSDVITLRGGNHAVSTPAILQHSGQEAYPIVVRGHPGEAAVLSAGLSARAILVEASRIVLRDLIFEANNVAVTIGPRTGQPITHTPSDVRIEGCIFRSNAVAISLSADGDTSADVARGEHFVIRGSAFESNGTLISQLTPALMIFSGDDIVIEDNRFHDNYAALHLAPPNIAASTGDLVGGTGLTVARNRFSDHQGPAGALSLAARGVDQPGTNDGWHDIRIVNNFMERGGAGIVVDRGGEPARIHAIVIAHNTFASLGNHLLVTAGNGVTIAKNIFAGSATTYIDLSAAASITAIDRNLYSDGTSAVFRPGGGDRVAFAAWQSAGLDEASRVGDPLFAAGDLHITAQSPAVDAAAGSPEVTLSDDIDGDSRPQGAGADIGADEFH